MPSERNPEKCLGMFRRLRNRNKMNWKYIRVQVFKFTLLGTPVDSCSYQLIMWQQCIKSMQVQVKSLSECPHQTSEKVWYTSLYKLWRLLRGKTQETSSSCNTSYHVIIKVTLFHHPDVWCKQKLNESS